MLLYQTSRSPHRSLFTNESGQVLYKTITPNIVHKSVTTISRIIPNSNPFQRFEVSIPALSHMNSSTSNPDVPQGPSNAPPPYYDEDKEGEGLIESESSDSEDEKYHDEDGVDMEDRFEIMGRIEWSFLQIGASTFDWAGKKQKTDEYFSNSGYNPMGRGKVFVGPDGRAYKWEMGWTTPKLVLHDGSTSPKVIARFHRAPFLQPSAPQWLEIDPEGEHMLDEIVFTYVYIERLRKNRERSARY